MRCGHCGAELVPGKKFCPGCGRAAGRPCARCGSVLPEPFRFCPECGAPVAGSPAVGAAAPGNAEGAGARAARDPDGELAPRPESPGGPVAAERKLVTVLFCDLAGSTAIAESLDPEEYRELLDRYLEIAIGEVYRFEGIVNQLAGDGLMALFGAPVAHEDDAERAVRAALGIRDALASLNDQRRAAGIAELHARIGIHTGPVVVGTVGTALKMDYTATGDTTNVAARIESMARPGSVLVSMATWRLVRGRFAGRPRGELPIRGKRTPVEAYEILGPLPESEGARRERALTPLVGREEELRQLEACLERAEAGLPQVVEIVGAMGTGKSRLVYEFVQRVRSRATVVHGRCESLGRMAPYGLWIAMLRGFFGISPGDGAEAAVERIRARLEGWAGLEGPEFGLLCRMLGLPGRCAAELGAEELRRKTFDAVDSMFRWLASRAPVIEVIEDVHWIDEGSREMLEEAVAQLGTARSMVVVTHRPDWSLAWRTRAVVTRMELRPLDAGAMQAVLRAQAGGPLPADLERRILSRAEGSPYFAEEIVRTLVEEGAIAVGADGPRPMRPLEELRIPATIQEVIESRLDHLGARAKRVLQVAAVLGRQFRRQDLVELLAGEGIDVDAELDALLSVGILHRKERLRDDELRFGESLTQEIAYETLLIRERRQLHARAAALLERGGLKLPGEGARLAHHLARSDNPARAVRALLESARQAEQIPSFAAAADLYAEAWTLATRGRPAAEGDALRRAAVEAAIGCLRMNVIYGATRGLDVAAIAHEALRLAGDLHEPQAAAALHSLQGMLMLEGGDAEFGRGLEIIAAGVRMAEEAGLGAMAAGLGRALAWAYLLDGRLHEARRRIEASLHTLAHAGAGGPNEELFGARFVRDKILFYQGDLEATLASAAETRELAVRHNNRTVRSGAAAVLAEAHLLRGNYGEAARLAREAFGIARQIGNRAAHHTSAAVLACALARTGEAVPARTLVDVLLRGSDESGTARWGPFPWGERSLRTVEALLAMGEGAAAERGAREALALGGRLRRMLASAALGEVLVRSRPVRADEARAAFLESGRLASEIGSTLGRVVSTLGTARAVLAEGDAEGAASLAEEALGAAQEAGLVYYAEQARRVRERARQETARAAV